MADDGGRVRGLPARRELARFLATIPRRVPPRGREHLDRIARLHDRQHRDVRPEFYDRWLDCLLQTIADGDPEFSPHIGQAWRATLPPHIAVMKAAY
jgi:hypothetical protein